MITKKNRGFLLIEVLITVAIVSGCVIFINHAFNSSFRAVSLSNDYMYALFLLEDKSFDFEIDPYAEKMESDGESEVADRRFSWKKTVSDLGKEDLGEDDYTEKEIFLKRFKFSVTWDGQGAERNLDLLTYIQAESEEEEE